MDNIDAVVADIARFCDPFTEPKTKTTSKCVKLALCRNGRDLAFEIDEATGRIESKHRRGVFPHVASLLASEEFANLQQLAKTQLRGARQDNREIPIRIKFEGAYVEGAELSTYINSKVSALRLLLLDGPAGIGKTYQIEKLVTSQADLVSKHRAVSPVLHVSSKGRRLSNLSDVLASSTQQLNASFGAAQVPTLVRRGLVIVAIDGFDELVDAQGYEDSWAALRSFLDDVGSSGTVLLAARDTFVDEQELLDKIGEESSRITLSIAHLQTSTADCAVDWLRGAPSWKSEDLDSDITREYLSEGSYALRPFFLRELQEARGWKEVSDVGLRTYLINRMLHRESVLIAQQLGGVKAEDIKPRLASLLEEIALEMGAREIDWIERDYLGFMTQYAFDGVLGEEAKKKLAHKSGTFAFLEVTEDPGRRSFSHSEIRNYFLGSALLVSIAEGTIPSVLRRAALTAEHVEVFAEVFESRPKQARKALEVLQQEFGFASGGDSFSANLGALLIMGSGLGLVSRLDYLDVIDATFCGGSPDLLINEGRIGRLDARGADLSMLRITESLIDTLVIDSSTVFAGELLGVENLEVRASEASELIRGAERVAQFIADYVERHRREVGPNPYVALLDKIARRVVRQHYLRERGGDDEGAFLLESQYWPPLRALLNEHGFLEVVRNKQMKGVNSNLIRVKRARSILERSDDSVVRLVSALEELD